MRSKLLAKGLAGAGVAIAVAGLVGFVGSGTSAAADQSLTLKYTCPFPLIGNQDLTVKIDLGLPATVVAGQTTPTISISSDVSVPATAVQGLNLVGAATVQGKAVANATVAAPGISGLAVSPSLAIPSTKVPASGTMDVQATGSTPGLDFPTAGTGSITVGNFTTTLDPKKSDGSDTGLGTFTSACTLDSGQSNVINFTIQPAGGPPPTSPPPTSPPPTSPPPTTPPPTSTPPSNLTINYSVKGSTHVQALGADVPVGPGTLDVNLDLGSGDFTGDLKLPTTTASFNLLGFLPGTSTVQLIPVGQTTGNFANGVAKSDSKETIRLTNVALFGFPIVSNSTTCQTKAPSDIPLTSGSDFNVQTGGTLTGTYTIPALTGCGFFNDYISAFTAGTGNTISVKIANTTTS